MDFLDLYKEESRMESNINTIKIETKFDSWKCIENKISV